MAPSLRWCAALAAAALAGLGAAEAQAQYGSTVYPGLDHAVHLHPRRDATRTCAKTRE